jgi:hypothetical protein
MRPVRDEIPDRLEMDHMLVIEVLNQTWDTTEIPA